MPLPISRIPSDQPLTIRKNRGSQSTASGSSASGLMAFSRDSSRVKSMAVPSENVSLLVDDSITPWPLLEASSHKGGSRSSSSNESLRTDHPSAQQALENSQQADLSTQSSPQRPSRMRRFTSSFSRLRRAGTISTAESNTSVPASLTATAPLMMQDGSGKDESSDTDSPTDDCVTKFMRKHGRDINKIASVVHRAANRLPSPFGNRYEQNESGQIVTDSKPMPTTLKVAVRILPESKLLKAEAQQDLWVAVEIEGVLHNRRALSDTTIDVAFIIDNGYYVSKECLLSALNAVTGALYYLNRGDRIALYTTHCTHRSVTGTVPDMLYPLRPFCKDTEEIFQDLTAEIGKCGTQAWYPPRPNPSMCDVVLAVAKSLESKDMRQGRTHVILFTPATHPLHEVSNGFPGVCFHQINPAVLHHHHYEQPQDKTCEEQCCTNVFVSSQSHYQSLLSRMKQIIGYARSQKPIGEVTNVHMDIRPKKGCEVLGYEGVTDIRYLRLGEAHSFFVQIRVTRSETQGLDTGSTDPFLNSSLGAYNLRQELRSAKTLGATGSHLLSVQVMHQNSLHAPECWNYSESQLVVTKDLGRLAPPYDTAIELCKRQLFHKYSQLKTSVAKAEIEELAAATLGERKDLKKLVGRMTKEIRHHQAVLEYEAEHRQKLPSCPGPICISASPHEWLVDKWDAKKNKRKGMAVM